MWGNTGRELRPPKHQQHHQEGEDQHDTELHDAGHQVIVGQAIGWVPVVTPCAWQGPQPSQPAGAILVRSMTLR